MKITAIRISNFQGLRAVDLPLRKPITIIAGNNAAGKSSVREAIHLALLAEPVRVKLKKEYGQLLRDDEKAGFIDISGRDGEGAEWSCSMHLPSGKVAGEPPIHARNALPYVIDAQRFASMPTDDRRTYLFGMMGLSMGSEEIRKRLAARSCDTSKVELVVPILRAGFPAACDEAKNKAREAKGAWRHITGEAWGSAKGGVWRPERVEFDAGDLQEAHRRRMAILSEHQEAKDAHAALHAQSKAVAGQADTLRVLREKADLEPRRKAKLDADARILDEAKAALAEMRAEAGEKPVPPVGIMICPCCAAKLLRSPDGSIAEYVPPDTKPYDAEVAAVIPQYEAAVATADRAHANSLRDHAESVTAAATLKATAVLHGPGDEEVEAARSRLTGSERALQDVDATIRSLESRKMEAEAADRKIKDAVAKHDEIMGWERIAEALAPDGVPAELLRDAISPINARMEQSSTDAAWLQPVITPNMDITATIATPGAGHRVTPYALLSESEQWRVDAIIAEAISYLTGARMLLLDRMDVLSVQGRTDLLEWLQILADQGEIDTAIVLGTLKSCPESTDLVDAVWIDDGRLAPPLAKAA